MVQNTSLEELGLKRGEFELSRDVKEMIDGPNAGAAQPTEGAPNLLSPREEAASKALAIAIENQTNKVTQLLNRQTSDYVPGEIGEAFFRAAGDRATSFGEEFNKIRALKKQDAIKLYDVLSKKEERLNKVIEKRRAVRQRAEAAREKEARKERERQDRIIAREEKDNRERQRIENERRRIQVSLLSVENRGVYQEAMAKAARMSAEAKKRGTDVAELRAINENAHKTAMLEINRRKVDLSEAQHRFAKLRFQFDQRIGEDKLAQSKWNRRFLELKHADGMQIKRAQLEAKIRAVDLKNALDWETLELARSKLEQGVLTKEMELKLKQQGIEIEWFNANLARDKFNADTIWREKKLELEQAGMNAADARFFAEIFIKQDTLNFKKDQFLHKRTQDEEKAAAQARKGKTKTPEAAAKQAAYRAAMVASRKFWQMVKGTEPGRKGKKLGMAELHQIKEESPILATAEARRANTYIRTAVEAMLRGLSGAAVPEIEVQRELTKWVPTYLTSDAASIAAQESLMMQQLIGSWAKMSGENPNKIWAMDVDEIKGKVNDPTWVKGLLPEERKTFKRVLELIKNQGNILL